MSPTLTAIVTAAGGVLAGLAAAAAVLWHQRQIVIRARYDATHDDTTGLPNRRALLTGLRRGLRDTGGAGLVLLDVDAFKTINDSYGHEAGNDVLAAVGHRLAALGAPVQLAARLSGDEFALLVRGGTGEVAGAASAAWRAVTRDPIPVGQDYLRVTASVGHATAGVGTSTRELLHAADMAMYEAKHTRAGICAATTWPVPRPRHTRYRDLPRH